VIFECASASFSFAANSAVDKTRRRHSNCPYVNKNKRTRFGLFLSREYLALQPRDQRVERPVCFPEPCVFGGGGGEGEAELLGFGSGVQLRRVGVGGDGGEPLDFILYTKHLKSVELPVWK